MAISFNWHDDEHTIIRIDIQDDTTWAEYHPAIDKVVDELETTTRRIDLILNSPNSMPPGNPMPHIKITARKLAAYPNMGVIVAVGNRSVSSIVQMLVSMVYRVYGIDTRIIGAFVNSLEEAEASIAQARAKGAAV